MQQAILNTLQEEAVKSADDLFIAVKDASFSAGNLLSVVETIDEAAGDLKMVLIAAFAMRLCKMGPRVKADYLRALSTVAMRSRA